MSLTSEDVAFLDEYASTHECPSRSAVVHQAIQALRFGGLHGAYDDSWAEWDASGEAGSWAQVEQVRSLDAERIGERLGQLPDRLMTSLDDALRLHLAL